MRQKKRIRELQRAAKSYPICRKQIEANRIVPHMLANTSGLYWDGFTAVDQNGKFWNGLSLSMQSELINMIIAGRYGEIAKEAFLDQTTYGKIRDQLIEWPNRENIERDGLKVVPLQLLDSESAEVG